MGLQSTTAPMSSRIDAPFSAGSTEMIAGRSTPSGRPSTKIAPAITAPELPADTIALARPDFTSSKQTRMELSLLAAHRLAGVVVHLDDLGGVVHLDRQRVPGAMPRELVAHARLGADQDDRQPLTRCVNRALHDRARGVVAPIASTATGAIFSTIGAYVASVICSPLYVPQDGQARCDSTGSLHFGHFVTFAGWILKFDARRRSRRMLLVRFFGTPTASSFVFSCDRYSFTFLRPAQRGSGTWRSQPHSRSFRLAPHTGQSPLQPSAQTG